MTSAAHHPAASTVTVVGEALIDIVATLDGENAEHPGGSPANVALGLGRLGHPVHLLTRIGNDERGARISDHLAASGVSVMPESMATEPTSTALAVIGEDGAATYTFDLRWELPEPLPEPVAGTQIVHIGSVAALLEPGGPQVAQLCARAREGATISYDPNIRPTLLGEPAGVRSQVEALVELTDVVKLSDEDATWLAPGTDPADLAQAWVDLGAALVVVTRGASGCIAATRGGVVTRPSRPVQVADTVGAGDSFSAALVAALDRHGLLGGERRDALRSISEEVAGDVCDFALGVAAITVSRPGADPPWAHELSV